MGEKRSRRIKNKEISITDKSSSSSVESEMSDDARKLKEKLEKGKKRQRISLDFNIQGLSDANALSDSATKAMNEKLEKTVKKMEQ